jgi:hypothetical protein
MYTIQDHKEMLVRYYNDGNLRGFLRHAFAAMSPLSFGGDFPGPNDHRNEFLCESAVRELGKPLYEATGQEPNAAAVAARLYQEL